MGRTVLEWRHLNTVNCPGFARFRARVTRNVVLCALTVLTLPLSASAQQGVGLQVRPLVRDDIDQVLVSFQLTDGYTDEVRAAIRSGLKTSFTYTVDLRIDVPGWRDRTIDTATVVSSVEYDNLEKRFTAVRSLNGRDNETISTEDEARVRQFLTNMVRLPLFRTRTLLPNRDYYILVGATARPSNGSLLWPFGSGTSAQAKFTFIR